MTFEAIRVPTLLLAHLTVKFQLLQALGLDAVGNILGCTTFCFGHVGKKDVCTLQSDGRRRYEHTTSQNEKKLKTLVLRVGTDVGQTLLS